MAPSNFTSLVGSFKIKYQEGKLKDFRLNVCPILDSVPFRKAATGTSIEMDIPVALTQHSGNTFQAAGANSVPKAPVPAVVLAAKVTNQEIVGALDVPFGVLQALSNGDVVSYLNPTLLRVFELEKSVRRDQEITHLHGNTGIGQVSALSAVTAFGAIFQRTITISGPTWASGIWKFMEGAPFDVYSLAQGGTKRNAALLTLGAGGVAGVLAQAAVSPATKQIVLTGATADLYGHRGQRLPLPLRRQRRGGPGAEVHPGEHHCHPVQHPGDSVLGLAGVAGRCQRAALDLRQAGLRCGGSGVGCPGLGA